MTGCDHADCLLKKDALVTGQQGLKHSPHFQAMGFVSLREEVSCHHLHRGATQLLPSMLLI